MSSDVDVREVAQMLMARAADLAPVLLPEGRREGREWRAGSRGSKSIVISGHNQGLYRDFETGDKACDLLDAIAILICNGSKGEAVKWAKGFLGLETMSEAARRAAAQAAARRRKNAERKQRQWAQKRARQAAAIWFGAAPIDGTPAAAYLAGRGVGPKRLSAPASALRYAGDVWCKARQGQHPAMVAAMWKIGEPRPVALHRTFLAVHEDGTATKAAVDPVRSILGPWPGALIPIARGETGRRWGEIEAGELVAFGEGIEEALSIAILKPEWRVASVGFVGNFQSITLPVRCRVVLAANNDPQGSEAAKALKKAADRLAGQGHDVRQAHPPAGFKDWNDFLRGIRSA